MAFWNLYFILKLYLYARHLLTPLWLANIGFALILGLGSLLRGRTPRALVTAAGIVVGLPLLYAEAHVPPFARVVQEFSGLLKFSASYWLELLARFVSLPTLLIAASAVALCLVVNRWLRMATFILIALCALPVWQMGHAMLRAADAQAGPAVAAPAHAAAIEGSPQASSHDAVLAAFRSREGQRRVIFPHAAAPVDAQFDVIFLHICSLSWDDLDVAKARSHPMLSHFDYLFSDFSTAASYSGPAAIRVLRASCGQQPHADLYHAAPENCHVLADLKEAGFTPQAMLNHDGHFGDFAQTVEANLGVRHVPLIPNADVRIGMHSFDGSPIYDDYAALAYWYHRRAAVAGPVALYYNTISLHDGNRLLDSPMSSTESYGQRVTRLMSDFDRFADLIASSGRRAVIIFVPEHGAALRGEQGQVAGLREVPSPQIVHGPVGVRLVGLQARHAPTTVISTPTSFLALAQLLANFVSSSPFAPGAALPSYAATLPQTDMVGENESTVTMRMPDGYVVKTPDGVWVDEH